MANKLNIGCTSYNLGNRMVNYIRYNTFSANCIVGQFFFINIYISTIIMEVFWLSEVNFLYKCLDTWSLWPHQPIRWFDDSIDSNFRSLWWAGGFCPKSRRECHWITKNAKVFDQALSEQCSWQFAPGCALSFAVELLPCISVQSWSKVGGENISEVHLRHGRGEKKQEKQQLHAV